MANNDQPSAMVLNYLASKQPQGRMATPEQRAVAASYSERAKTVEGSSVGNSPTPKETEKKVLDRLREVYQNLGAGSPTDYKKLSFLRTYLHYKFGNGRPMYIDITGLHFPTVSAKRDFNNEVGRTESINTFSLWPSNFTEAGLSLGGVTFKYLGNNKVSIVGEDTYDFDYQKESSLKRNLATVLGGIVHNMPFLGVGGVLTSGGQAYDIYFKGKATIEN